MKKTVFTLLWFTSSLFAMDLSVMTFNIMCDFCHKSDIDRYKNRLPTLQAIIADHQTDLVALQEVRTGRQVKDLFSQLDNYTLYYTDSILMSYADPAIAFKKERFELIDKDGFWLGPSDGFSFGWKMALPRRVLWVKLRDKKTKNTFYFITSHFDNRIENLIESSVKLKNFIQTLDAPVIFAADTNSNPDFSGYQNFIDAGLVDTYTLIDNISLHGEMNSEKDLCYYRKGKTFPKCRVDHVFVDQDLGASVSEWIIDLTRFSEEGRFPSDHRPIITKLKLKFTRQDHQ